MPTIRDVARASGVSPATVSYVLNDGPKKVRPNTRERVLRTMREMNYHPSAVARGLTRKRMNAIGVIFPNEFSSLVGNPYVGPLLEGVLDAAARNQHNVTLFTGHLWSNTEHSLPFYCDGRCDGMMLISPPEKSDIVAALLNRDVPCLLAGTTSEEPSVSSIDIDNLQAAYELVSYLIGQGHRRIAYIGGENSMQSARLRAEGYGKALQEGDIPYRPELAPQGCYRESSSYERTIALMKMPRESRPTALFCGNDEMALGAIRAVKDLGFVVPRDVSVAGFDDIAAAETSIPPLTTIRQPVRLLGERAAEVLIEKIKDRKPIGQKETLYTELIVRSSVARPSSA